MKIKNRDAVDLKTAQENKKDLKTIKCKYARTKELSLLQILLLDETTHISLNRTCFALNNFKFY